ncbi:MAG: protein kinase domain-containing protein [Inhella sp.]
MSDPLSPPPDDLNALPPGTRFGELEIQRLLGAGGFGIVYLARDHALERLVAIKEYMPGQLAQRSVNSQVSVRSGSMRETFELGLRSFVNEARLLARFDHRSLLKVYRFWEANNTAYMAMPYLQGQTLKQWRDARGSAPEGDWLLKLLKPLLEALAELHAANVYHRDIAPDNIFLPADGGDPILLDFGAARRAIGDRTQSFTAILKPSYAPLEQYDGVNALKQGPWTDLYALGAVLYHLITGSPPPAATRRALNDDYQPLASRPLPGYAPSLLAAIDWSLALRPQERPQSVGEFQEAMLGQREIPFRALPSTAAGDPTVIDGGNEATVVVSSATVPTVQPVHEATQLLTQVNRRYEAELTSPLTQPAPAVASTLAMPAPQAAPPAPAPSAPKAQVPGSTAAAASAVRGKPWWLVGALTALGLLVALWMVLRNNASAPGVAAVADAASAASAPDGSASQLAGGATSGRPAPALEAGESFVEPLPAPSKAPETAIAQSVAKPAVRVEEAAVAGAGREPSRADMRGESPRPRPATGLVAQEPTPAPLQQPAPQASLPPAVAGQEAPGAADPRAACGSRVFIALTMCIDRKCKEPAHALHPECVRLREIREQRERN